MRLLRALAAFANPAVVNPMRGTLVVDGPTTVTLASEEDECFFEVGLDLASDDGAMGKVLFVGRDFARRMGRREAFADAWSKS